MATVNIGTSLRPAARAVAQDVLQIQGKHEGHAKHARRPAAASSRRPR